MLASFFVTTAKSIGSSTTSVTFSTQESTRDLLHLVLFPRLILGSTRSNSPSVIPCCFKKSATVVEVDQTSSFFVPSFSTKEKARSIEIFIFCLISVSSATSILSCSFNSMSFSFKAVQPFLLSSRSFLLHFL